MIRSRVDGLGSRKIGPRTYFVYVAVLVMQHKHVKRGEDALDNGVHVPAGDAARR